MNNIREIVIRNYIDGYNQFDVERMLVDFDDSVIFENIQNSVINLSLKGLTALKKQAETAGTYFTERKQTIKSIKHFGNSTEIEIDYHAVLAIDFPNGLKKGEEIQLTGKSVFEFKENKVVKLTDFS